MTKKGTTNKPTKLTPEVSASIEKALKLGNFRKTAAAFAGIGYRTFLDWMELGVERPTSIYGDFRNMVVAAETGAEVMASGVLLGAASRSPKWALAWLRVRHRRRWSPPDKMELTGKDGGPMEMKAALDDYTDEELALIEQIQTAAAARRRAEGKSPAEP